MIHYGKELKKAIKKQGLKKTSLSKRLKTSRVTLDQHLVDGDFSDSQIEIIKQIIEKNG